MLDDITARFDAVTGGVMKGCSWRDSVDDVRVPISWTAYAGFRKVNVFRMCAVQKIPQPVQTGRGCSSSPVFILYIQIELSQPRDGKNRPYYSTRSS